MELSAAEVEAHPNPYVSVELRAEFRSPNKGTTYVMPAFWDGGATFRIRFSPLDPGRWDFRLISNLESLDKKIASFNATPPRTPGFVRIFNMRYFRYDQPETAHFWMGDTCYKFATIPFDTFRALIDKRAEQKFNHLRGLVLGFDENAEKGAGRSRPAAAEYFREVDRRVAYMNSKGITYDVLLAGDQQPVGRPVARSVSNVNDTSAISLRATPR